MSIERGELRVGLANTPVEEARAEPLDVSDLTTAMENGAVRPWSELPTHDRALTRNSVMDRHMGELLDRLIGGSTRLHGELAPGTCLGRHRLERKLGAGGMGEVFAARDVETDEEVALKMLTTTSATRLYRFKREFRALADVSHHNLIRLHELVVPATGAAYFTMELVDGQPFVAWVRDTTPLGEPPDLARLSDALRQLVEGIHHLHTHNCIHRDLKPSNVLVTSEGRVVVLDFGLVSDLSDPDAGITRESQILGTPSYMAPEQALGSRVGPAADYYAIGVMLFECLTGRQPHRGPPQLQLLAKQARTPDPGDHGEGSAAWLRKLCIQLLSRDPNVRPGGQRLLERLRVSGTPGSPMARVFVGRKKELAELEAALQEVHDRHELVIVHIRGKSGDGKSALVRQFRAERCSAETVVLHGSCRERETVPYKGLDAVVDALSAYVRRLPKPERAALRPPDLDALVRVFPVLDEIWEPGPTQNLGPSEVRKLGGVTLRKLLKRVAETHPLVVHIDDFQWADLDSVSLLQALVWPPEPPPMLLLLSYRSETMGSDGLRELLASDVLTTSRTHMLELGPLSAHSAYELASMLLRAHEDADTVSIRGQAQAIALRAFGSPFFIAQMALGGGNLETSDSNLDHIIADRLSEIDPPARELLEVVAVFGGPLRADFALELCVASTEANIGSLCMLGLLVREEHRDPGLDGRRIEMAHDRVRDAVLAELHDDERTRLHWRIGERLLERNHEAPKADGLFAAVDHLDAGIGHFDSLSDDKRLELARLNCSAGERALESAAWVAARRYLDCAYGLVEPWLERARCGGDHYELCVAIAFDRAQTKIALGNPEGDAAIDEILGWSLTMSDYCRITQWYSRSLGLRTRWPECVDFGMKALARIGFRVSSKPSWPRALLSYFWGWRSIRLLGRDRLKSLSPIADDRIRAAMEILAATSSAAVYVDIKLHLALMGTYGRHLAKHGFHDGVVIALSSLIVSAAARGQIHEAKELHRLVHDLASQHNLSTIAHFMSQSTLLVGLPIFRPVHAVVASGASIFQRACEVAPQDLVEMIGMACDYNHALAGVPLPIQVDFLQTIEVRHGGFGMIWARDRVAMSRRLIYAMVQGPTEQAELPSLDATSSIGDVRQMASAVSLIWTALSVGDHDRAWKVICMIAGDCERKLRASWYAPVYCVLSVIVMMERWSSSPTHERRRMRRAMRRGRTIARCWAKRCAENYGPMLDVIDGELAGLDGRYQEAVTAFERARAVASVHRMYWLSGLSSERLAKLARRRGHAIFAEAAFQAACRAYSAWGATAVVHRLETERLATSTFEVEQRGSTGRRTIPSPAGKRLSSPP